MSTFHPFPRLPFELREVIWKAAVDAPPPTLIVVDHQLSRYGTRANLAVRNWNGPRTEGPWRRKARALSQPWIVTLLAVSKEARAVAKPYVVRCLGRKVHYNDFAVIQCNDWRPGDDFSYRGAELCRASSLAEVRYRGILFDPGVDELLLFGFPWEAPARHINTKAFTTLYVTTSYAADVRKHLDQSRMQHFPNVKEVFVVDVGGSGFGSRSMERHAFGNRAIKWTFINLCDLVRSYPGLKDVDMKLWSNRLPEFPLSCFGVPHSPRSLWRSLAARERGLMEDQSLVSPMRRLRGSGTA